MITVHARGTYYAKAYQILARKGRSGLGEVYQLLDIDPATAPNVRTWENLADVASAEYRRRRSHLSVVDGGVK